MHTYRDGPPTLPIARAQGNNRFEDQEDCVTVDEKKYQSRILVSKSEKKAEMCQRYAIEQSFEGPIALKGVSHAVSVQP